MNSIYSNEDPRDILINMLLHRLQEQAKLINEYQLVLDHSPGHLFLVNAEHILLGVNLEQAKILKSTPEELVGKHLSTILPPEDAQYLMQINQQVMDSKKISVHEEYVCLESGEEKWFLTKKIPVLNDQGNSIGVVGVSLDITEQKKAHKLQHQWSLDQKYFRKVKSDFVANMSHDIRTPLTGIIGMASILNQRLLVEEDKQYARWIEESAKQLIDFLNMLLNINLESTSDEATTETLQLSMVSIKDLIENLLALEYPALEHKKLNFQLHCSFNIPAFVLTDYEKLYRILLNLLGNAIKFTPSGGSITINIEVIKLTDTSVQLGFKIIDNGPGFSQQFLQQFQSINQPRSTNTTIDNQNAEKKGLGLLIVKQYLTLFNEKLQIENQSQGGSLISFMLNCELPVEDEKTIPKNQAVVCSHDIETVACIGSAASSQKVLSEEASKQSKILIVEDNRIIAHLLQYGVQNLKMLPTIVNGMQEAVMAILRNTYDFIITDLGLPDGSGVDLIRIIRSHELMHHVPIIVLSAHLSKEIRKECLELGATEILEKPITLEKLKQVVETYKK